MTKRTLPTIIFLCLAAAAAPAGCTASTSSSGGNPESSGDGGTPGTGTLGGPCDASGACGSGLTCVGPGLVPSSPERYCAPTCETISDCDAFGATSYSIGVPDTVTPLAGNTSSTIWKSKTLSRGVACAPLDSTPNAPKYCMFGCPDFAAVAPDANGNLTECYCLPGYSLDSSKTACKYGTSHQCSIFSYGTDQQRQELLDKYGIESQKTKCDACNSSESVTDTLNCHTGEFFCNLDTTSLNGDCAEGLSNSQFQQCVAQQTNFSCDCSASCQESCTDADSCYGCCTCTPTSSPPPKPTCSGDGGTSGDAGSGSSSGGSTDSGGPAVDSGVSDTGGGGGG